MLSLQFESRSGPLRVLCVGAHSDDIEIGCGGTLIRWQDEHPGLEITWAVFSAAGGRADEARRSAAALLAPGARMDVVLGELEDGHFPADYRRCKSFMAELRDRVQPDVVFSHHQADRHQDHRMVAEVTWQTWRDHLILEYDIPKYEGDTCEPNLFVALSPAQAQRKVDHLLSQFESQRSKAWFSRATFDAVLRLRGIESRSPTGLAEGFRARKVLV